MSVFAIGDLHLSLGADKPMDIFKGWDNYVERIEKNWNFAVTSEDTVIIPGDVSWAMTLEQAYNDFQFIHQRLNGKKIISKGNHDYWWNTTAKMKRFLSEHNLSSISILHNNAYLVEGIVLCGSRGWINETEEETDLKVLKREAGRLELSIKEGLTLGENLAVFLHYPPIYGGEKNYFILDVLKKYNIKHCYYGHIHGSGVNKAFQGEWNDVNFYLISSDLVDFIPQKVKIF